MNPKPVSWEGVGERNGGKEAGDPGMEEWERGKVWKA